MILDELYSIAVDSNTIQNKLSASQLYAESLSQYGVFPNVSCVQYLYGNYAAVQPLPTANAAITLRELGTFIYMSAL